MSLDEWVFGEELLAKFWALVSWASVLCIFPTGAAIVIVRLLLAWRPVAWEVVAWLVAPSAAWTLATLTSGRWLGWLNLVEPAGLGLICVVLYTYCVASAAKEPSRKTRWALSLVLLASVVTGAVVPPLSDSP
jgi:hypothetical protein